MRLTYEIKYIEYVPPTSDVPAISLEAQKDHTMFVHDHFIEYIF